MAENINPKIAGKKLYVEATIREQFAAMAMQGLCSSPELTPNSHNTKYFAELAVKLADDLIKELNK